MEKNVTVVDEEGNEIGATYPKRAKGLAKKGRARYVNDNTICLACPADIHSEETMENNITLKDILDKMDALRDDTRVLNNALLMLTTNLNLPDDLDEEMLEDMSEMYHSIASGAFREREFTNRELIQFYTMVYQDLKNKEE